MNQVHMFEILFTNFGGISQEIVWVTATSRWIWKQCPKMALGGSHAKDNNIDHAFLSLCVLSLAYVHNNYNCLYSLSASCHNPSSATTPLLFYLVSPSGHLQPATQHHVFSKTSDCQNHATARLSHVLSFEKVLHTGWRGPGCPMVVCNVHYDIWQGLALWAIVSEFCWLID